MAHNANVVAFGQVPHTFKNIVNKKGDVLAGLVVHIKNDDTLSLLKSDGPAHGISLGKDLANAGRTAIVLAGHNVPIRLTASFSPVIGAQVFVSDTTGLAGASGAGFTGINARYLTGAKDALLEDGTTVTAGAALISMPGGV